MKEEERELAGEIVGEERGTADDSFKRKMVQEAMSSAAGLLNNDQSAAVGEGRMVDARDHKHSEPYAAVHKSQSVCNHEGEHSAEMSAAVHTPQAVCNNDGELSAATLSAVPKSLALSNFQRQKELQCQRMRARRANMTEEERAVQREKDRERARQRRVRTYRLTDLHCLPVKYL